MWSSSRSNNSEAGSPQAGSPQADSPQADTIVALSTPPGFGAVAIVRLSGPRALVIGRMLAPGVRAWRPRYATRCTVVDGAGCVIDDALALAFPAPRSYTGEDVLELHVHGSPAIAREVLIAAVAAGARLALPGEYTRRAFLNGKMDLSAAEAVGDLIAAEHRSAARAARARLSGGLDACVRDLAGRVDVALQALAASLDYPDEVEPPDPEAFARELVAIEAALSELTEGFERGRVVREGVAVAIAGPPNAGKSSLLNALLGHDRALVSSIAGTTRDTIEETLALGSLVARITDTAGLRATHDELEAAGIARSRDTVESARIVLVVVEAPAVGVEAQAVLELTRERRRVVLFNKSDLGRDGFDARGPAETDAILGSAHDAVTVSRVRLRLRELAEWDEAPDLERPALGTARQAAAVLAARESLGFALETLRAGDALDLTAMPLVAAAARLRELSGRDASEALLDGIFGRFCVGK